MCRDRWHTGVIDLRFAAARDERVLETSLLYSAGVDRTFYVLACIADRRGSHQVVLARTRTVQAASLWSQWRGDFSYKFRSMRARREAFNSCIVSRSKHSRPRRAISNSPATFRLQMATRDQRRNQRDQAINESAVTRVHASLLEHNTRRTARICGMGFEKNYKSLSRFVQRCRMRATADADIRWSIWSSRPRALGVVAGGNLERVI